MVSAASWLSSAINTRRSTLPEPLRSGTSLAPSWPDRHRRPAAEQQVQGEAAAASRAVTAGFDTALMQLHQGFGQRESNAQSSFRAVARST